MTSGNAIFFDGRTSARHAARVVLGAGGLQVAGGDGRLLADWPYDQIEEIPAPAHVLRLKRRGNALLERLDVHDTELAAVIDERAAHVDRTGSLQRRQRLSVIGWTFAATVSLGTAGYFGVPAIAERLTPLIPVSIERKLGDAVDMQVRAMLDPGNAGTGFECGSGEAEKPGRAALDKIMRRLEAAAGLPEPLRASVVRRGEANAMALPGGKIYVFRGLIMKADSADEVAGVIAHEIGHIAHRDGTKAILQASGLSFLFGMLLGDFVGGGAVVLAAKTVLQSSYSRGAEAAADAYGVQLMKAAGGDARALATLLAKIGGATEPGMKILLDHPETKARVAAIESLAGTQAAVPFISAGEWAALKRICAGP